MYAGDNLPVGVDRPATDKADFFEHGERVGEGRGEWRRTVGRGVGGRGLYKRHVVSVKRVKGASQFPPDLPQFRKYSRNDSSPTIPLHRHACHIPGPLAISSSDLPPQPALSAESESESLAQSGPAPSDARHHQFHRPDRLCTFIQFSLSPFPHCSLLFLCSVSPQTCPSSTQPPDQRASSARSPSPRKACQPMYARPVADALLHRACRLHSRSTFGSSRAPMKPCTLLYPLLPYHFLRASISERRSERVTAIVPCIRIPVPPSPPSIPLLFFAGVSMQNPN